jgi:oligopeptide/dipeptide ABC transporter ATP-binding protein
MESNPSPTPPLLRGKNIKKYFSASNSFLDRLIHDNSKIKAVNGIDIQIDKGENVGIVGESGCGKTTLGRVLANLYNPTEGKIEFEGKDISELSKDELKEIRKDIQVIFQDPLSSLNPRKTAYNIVRKPLDIHDIGNKNEREEIVNNLFEEVGLNKEHFDRYAHEFSGGQRQRVGIARALAVNPKLIVADEPVSALDVSIQAQIINLMKNLQKERELSYLFIAHDLSVIKHITDRCLVMYLGKIVEKGSTDVIFSNPEHPYTRALLRSIPRVDARPKDLKQKENLLKGNPPSPKNPPKGCQFHPRCPEFIGDECVKKEPKLVGSDQETEHQVACHWMAKNDDMRRSHVPPNTEERVKGTEI